MQSSIMPPKILLAVLLILLKVPLFAQFILPSSIEDSVQQKLAALPDSSYSKIVDKVYLELRSNGTIIKSITFDITNQFKKLWTVPDSIRLQDYCKASLVVEFKGFLFEFFNKGNKQVLFDFDLDKNEIDFVSWLKSKNMGVMTSTQIVKEWRTIKIGDNPDRKQYVEVKKQIATNYYDTPEYSVIDCKIGYEPSGADIYVIPSSEWVQKYKLKDPPVENEITKEVCQKLFNLKINKNHNPLSIQLNEKSYIVMFDRNGIITFGSIKPSNKYIDRNIIHTKIK